jgi:uncharacterized repeat protein (TIGR03803 family)
MVRTPRTARAAGGVTTLQSFALLDGAYALALLQGADGDFYGAAYAGGTKNARTVFRMARGGWVRVLHTFSGCRSPKGPPRQRSASRPG